VVLKEVIIMPEATGGRPKRVVYRVEGGAVRVDSTLQLRRRMGVTTPDDRAREARKQDVLAGKAPNYGYVGF
jgi:hypothetical protein